MTVFGAFGGYFQKALFRPILDLFSAMSMSSKGPTCRQIVEMCRKTLFPTLLDLYQCVKTDNNIEKVPFHRSFLGRILASVFGPLVLQISIQGGHPLPPVNCGECD